MMQEPNPTTDTRTDSSLEVTPPQTLKIPLSLRDTAVGYAIFRLDQHDLPKTIELFQREQRGVSPVFNIIIEDESLRRFFALEDIKPDTNESTLTTIQKMLIAATNSSHYKGLKPPSEEQTASRSPSCWVNVLDSNETVSFNTNLIPRNIEEWSSGHKRCQVTAERKDYQGRLLCELHTESLEYPDGAINLNVKIMSYLAEHSSQSTHYFTLNARGPMAHSLILAQLVSLHNDITELTITSFLNPYFSTPTREPGFEENLMKPDQEYVNSPLSAHDDISGHTLPEQLIRDCGESLLTTGAKIAWDRSREDRDLLYIYPDATNSSYRLTLPHIGKDASFPNMVRELADENPHTRAKIVKMLACSSRKWSYENPEKEVNSGLLTEFVFEKLDLYDLKKLERQFHRSLSGSEKIIAALEGKEWIGYRRDRSHNHASDLYKHIPYEIFLRVRQDSCDKIILICHGIKDIDITPKKGDLFYGSIPEVRAMIANTLRLFNENPFKLLESYDDPQVNISSVFGRTVSKTFLHRLSFFSDLLVTEAKEPKVVLTSPYENRDLLFGVARSPELTISNGTKEAFGLHFHFRNDRLTAVTLTKKTPQWLRRFMKIRETPILQQEIPRDIHFTPNEVTAFSMKLNDILSSHFHKRTDNSKLLENLKSAFDSLTHTEDTPTNEVLALSNSTF